MMNTCEYIGLSTQSVGVGPGMYRALDQLLYSEPNHLSLVARFETSGLNVHACVSLRLVLSFLSIRTPHHTATISHRRVAIVDYWGDTVFDFFVKPTLPVSDYRTSVTGISPEDLESGECGTFILRDGTHPADPLTPYVLQPPQIQPSPSIKPKVPWQPALSTR